MADKRMFSKKIIDSDEFLEMPSSARLLYFDLGMRADDDGFVNSPKKIVRMTGASDGDMRCLFERKFIIPFESGVVVIRHWKINNYIRNDRYNETIYKKEKESLLLDESGVYLLNTSGVPTGIPNDNQVVYQRDTQISIDKNSIDKNSLVCAGQYVELPKNENKDKKNIYCEAVKLTEQQYNSLIEQFGQAGANDRIENLSLYVRSKGDKYKCHYSTILSWERKNKKEQPIITKQKPKYEPLPNMDDYDPAKL
jgi:hypothetical protein